MIIQYIPHSIDEHNISLVHNNETHIIPRSAINYNQVKDALLNADYDSIPNILDAKKTLETHSNGLVSCNGEVVTYKGEEIHNSACAKLLNLIADGYINIDPWLLFIGKLMENPSHNSREQAYKFIEHKGMPLTKDGNIIGYKGVNANYTDRYSGKFDNSVGQRLSMSRANVDDNINNGCSQGFHVGSHDYADSWGGSDGKLMLIEFSPKDIVSVPHCSEYAKLRVCEYLVTAECLDRKILNDSGVYGHSENKYGGTENIVSHTYDIGCRNRKFSSLQRSLPGITVNEVIDAFLDERFEPPIFEYSNLENDLMIQLQDIEALESVLDNDIDCHEYAEHGSHE